MYAGVPTSAPVLVTVAGTRPRVDRIADVRGIDRLLREPREPEVHDAHGAVAPDHDVLGLEVAVDDAGGVRGRQPAPGGDEHVQDLAPAARLRAQPLVDGLALDELHRDEDAIVDRAGVVDGDDVRVRQARDGARLAQQARAALGRCRAPDSLTTFSAIRRSRSGW